MNLMEILDITSTNILLIIANIVLIILAVFLLFKLKKSNVKPEEEFEHGAYLKKESETDLTGIADIKPEEFNPERFDIKKDFFTLAATSKTTPVEMGSPEIPQPVKQEEKHEEVFVVPPAEKLAAPPELKLFTLDETKKPEEISAPASTELLTPGKAEKPATLIEGLSGETSIQEQKLKKASKRKSLF